MEDKNKSNDAEINIWIDKYADVFSEFDSRPYDLRALSDDFLREVQKMVSTYTANDVCIKFNVFLDERNPETENIIINTLNRHFLSIAAKLKTERNDTLKKGYLMLGLGSALILFLFYITSVHGHSGYMNGLTLMLEPVGWFTTWTGLDHVFQISQKHKSDLSYSSKMSLAKISFTSLEDKQKAPRGKRTVIPFDNENLRVA